MLVLCVHNNPFPEGSTSGKADSGLTVQVSGLLEGERLMNNFGVSQSCPATSLPKDFDPEVYLSLHEDVKYAKVDPASHYLAHGRAEGRPYKIEKAKTFEEALAEFLTVPPSEQNAFDLFPTAWSSAFEGVQTSGNFKGADDARLKWLFQKIDVRGKSVLELGPLEAAHTYMLESAGASVLAIESNKGAFLRSLITKNYLGMKAKFLLGDFEKMDISERHFDLVMASGVLYHMKDPIALLNAISKTTDNLFIWTHYFEPDLSKWNASLSLLFEAKKWEYEKPITQQFDSLNIRMVKQHYGDAIGWNGFCGGSDVYSNWIYREDLIALLRKLGFSRIDVEFDDVKHQNGPAFCLLCQKT